MIDLLFLTYLLIAILFLLNMDQVMYNCATMAESIHDAASYGFTIPNVSFSWETIKKVLFHTVMACFIVSWFTFSIVHQSRDAYVLSLNGMFDEGLQSANITKVTGWAKFVGPRQGITTEIDQLG